LELWSVLSSEVGEKLQKRNIFAGRCGGAIRYPVRSLALVTSLFFSTLAAAEGGESCPKMDDVKRAAQSYQLEIEQTSLIRALLDLATQTELELFYPHELTAVEGTFELEGSYSVREAICTLMANTNYFGNLTESGVITIALQDKTREEPEMKKSRKGLLAALVSFFTATGGQVAMAQNESLVLEEVLVTAQKREAAAQDVGAALSAISQSALEVQGDINVDSLADLVPGLEIANNGPGNNQVAMRGVGTLGGGFQSVSSVGYYLDETPMSAFTSLPEIGLYDVERVEVLRGPQGTLFGDGSMGGTIRVITNKPDPSEFSASVAANAGTIEDGDTSMSFRGLVNLPLVEDALALRAVFGYKDDAGWIDVPALGEDDVNESEILDTRISLRWTPSDELTVDLNYFHNEIEISGDFAETGKRGLFDPQSIQPFAGVPSEIGIEDSEYDLFTLTVNYDLGFANLVSATSHFDYESEFLLPLSEFSNLFFGVPGEVRQVGSADQSSLIQELRLVSNSDSNFRWTVGGFYKDVERDGTDDFQISIPLFGIIGDSSLSSLAFESTSLALFAELEYDLSQDLTLIAGGRYFDDERSYVTQDLVASLIFGGDPTIVNPTNETDETKFSPKVSLQWRVSEEVMLFATYSEGFRSGGINTNARPDAPCGPGAPGYDSRCVIPVGFGSETVTAYEIGIKSNPSDNLQINAYVYLNEWEDLHLNGVTADGLFGFNTNAGEAETEGAELELLFSPVNGLVLGLNAAYTDATIAKDVVNALGGVVAQGGNVIPFVPELTFNASATYRFPFVGNYDGLVYASYTHRDENFSDIENTAAEENESLDRVNVRLGMESNRFGIYLYANNLLDEEGTTFRNNVVAAIPMVYESFVRPRTIGVELTANF